MEPSEDRAGQDHFRRVVRRCEDSRAESAKLADILEGSP